MSEQGDIQCVMEVSKFINRTPEFAVACAFTYAAAQGGSVNENNIKAFLDAALKALKQASVKSDG